MLIAISGQPHSGKTTLLKNCIEKRANSGVKSWGFWTEEIKDLSQPSQRSGFKLLDASGSDCVLASVDIQEEPRVSRYGVDLDSLNSFLSKLRDPLPGELVYIDEIGEMEMLSDPFPGLVRRWEQDSDHLIVTLSEVFADPLIDELKERADLLVRISKENRNSAADELDDWIKHLK